MWLRDAVNSSTGGSYTVVTCASKPADPADQEIVITLTATTTKPFTSIHQSCSSLLWDHLPGLFKLRRTCDTYYSSHYRHMRTSTQDLNCRWWAITGWKYWITHKLMDDYFGQTPTCLKHSLHNCFCGNIHVCIAKYSTAMGPQHVYQSHCSQIIRWW